MNTVSCGEVRDQRSNAGRRAKVGLMFLVCGDLNQPALWAEYLEQAGDLVSVHCHAKYPAQITMGPLAGRVIEERHATQWGEVSLVRAMLALLRAGLEDGELTHFMFLSESCIPIRPAGELTDLLSRDPRSRFHFLCVHDAYQLQPEKPGRLAHLPRIPRDHRHFQPQWVLLERAAAELLVANDWTMEFEGVFAADECYFSTVLSICGWDLAEQVAKEDVTWCQWYPGACHPSTIHEVTPELRGQWKASGRFFARKIARGATWLADGEQPWNHRTAIINDLISRIGGIDYLEIGCGDDLHFSAIRCERKVSVDPAVGDYSHARPTYQMTSDQFFATQTGRFDVAFIDGLHHADQVERDLRNALAVLKSGGIVVCHDLNPTSEAMQAVPRIQREWTGDGWKAWVRLRVDRPDLDMLVIDADYGVGLIVSGESRFERLPRVPEVDLTWSGLVEHRREWLNLLVPAEAKSLVTAWLPKREGANLPKS